MTKINTGTPRVPVSSDYGIVDQICKRSFGHRLMTVLSYSQGAAEVQRVYSSNPGDYPIDMSKPMGMTDWGRIEPEGGQSWFCDAEEPLRWAFPDAD
jgi:phage tail protein X